jgi:non-specific serine/threonine protein kinase
VNERILQALADEYLLRAAGRAAYEKGKAYFFQKRVEIEQVEDDAIYCTVNGSRIYSISIELHGKALYYDCSCPNAGQGNFCKHLVAAAMAVRAQASATPGQVWKGQVRELLDGLEEESREKSLRQYVLVFKLERVYGEWGLSALRAFPGRLTEGEAIDWNDPARVADFVRSRPNLQLEPVREPGDLSACLNAGSGAPLLASLAAMNDSYNYYTRSKTNPIPLLWTTSAPVFHAASYGRLGSEITVCPDPCELEMAVTHASDGTRLTTLLRAGGQVLPVEFRKGTALVSKAPPVLLVEDNLYRITRPAAGEVVERLLSQPELFVPPADEAEFLEKFYPRLARHVDLRGDAIEWQEVVAPPVPRLYLSENKGAIAATLRFGYGEIEAACEAKPEVEMIRQAPGSWNLVRVLRDLESENRATELLADARYGLKRGDAPGQYEIRARVHAVDFLMRCVPLLAGQGFEIYGEEQLKSARVNRSQPSISFSVKSGIDWFDLEAAVKFGEQEVALADIRKALRRKERFIRLADGTIGQIPDEWLDRYRNVFALGEEQGDGLRYTGGQITLLDQLLEQGDRVRTDEGFRRQRERMRSFESIRPHELPGGFNGELRPYQKAGYDWLHFLHEYEFGGCLADDMGLGKTVQVLTFLQSLREGGQARAADLIVLPKSLLVNWQREAERFTPNLRLMEYHGYAREKDTSAFDRVDLVITTYGTMLKDVELLGRYRFHYVVLDESQAIKNPASQSARAVRLLQSDHRLVMTGTPVENNTIELWSQFAFLNPGLLGSMDYFKEEFANRIEKNGDLESAEFLRRMVYPFILRRTKEQVAPELPPLTERVLYTDMEPEQRKLYEKTRDYYRGLLMGMIDGASMNDARMKILEGLLRLRQICIHPRLVDGNYAGESAKFELLFETLDTLAAEGHKALIFSQFVETLELVRAHLDGQGTRYTFLTGKTPDRQDQVDRFQNDPALPFFLISLKAGGVGLNLTAADYVIHIDPWWNPAVEMQASDRAHRIGQERPVFVFKLIARDTVEEKILELQERKKGLVDQLISTEGSFFKSLSPEDVKVLFS